MADFRSPFVPGAAALHRRRRRLSRLRRGGVVRAGARRSRRRPPTAPIEAGFMLFDTVLAFDHVQHRILIIANARITRGRRPRVAVSVRVREDSVPRARARAQPLASRGRDGAAALDVHVEPHARAVRGAGPHGEGVHRRRRHLPGRAVAALRGRGRAPIRSPSTARCATSTRRRTCISSAWAACRSSARRRRCWCASRARASRRIRSPARGRADATTKRTCGWPRS